PSRLVGKVDAVLVDLACAFSDLAERREDFPRGGGIHGNWPRFPLPPQRLDRLSLPYETLRLGLGVRLNLSALNDERAQRSERGGSRTARLQGVCIGKAERAGVALQRGRELIGFELDSRQVPLLGGVRAALLEQVLDRRRLRERSRVAQKSGGVFDAAPLLSFRPLHRFGGGALLLERRCHSVRLPGGEGRKVGEAREPPLGLGDLFHYRGRPLEPRHPRPLDLARAALRAKRCEFCVERVDVGVETTPAVDPELLRLDRLARRRMSFESLVEAPVGRLPVAEDSVRLRFEGGAQLEQIAQARRRFEQRGANIAIRLEHRLSALPQRGGVEAERAAKRVLADAAEHGFERVIGQHGAVLALQRVLPPLAPPNGKHAAVRCADFGADPQLLAGIAKRVGRAVRNAVEQSADRGQRRRLSRLVRPINDMQFCVRAEPQAEVVESAEFLELERPELHRSQPISARESVSARASASTDSRSSVAAGSSTIPPGSLARTVPMSASSAARRAGSSALSLSAAERSSPASAASLIRREGAVVPTRSLSSHTSSPQRCAAASVLSRRSGSARRRACSGAAPAEAARTASMRPSAASACRRTAASTARIRDASSSCASAPTTTSAQRARSVETRLIASTRPSETSTKTAPFSPHSRTLRP